MKIEGTKFKTGRVFHFLTNGFLALFGIIGSIVSWDRHSDGGFDNAFARRSAIINESFIKPEGKLIVRL